MTDYLALSVFIILIVISESIAQNFIKKGSLNGDKTYLMVSVFFYGFVCYFLYRLYGNNHMGPVFLLWSMISSLSIYLVGYFFYGEVIGLNDLIGFLLCAIGLYLVFISDHKSKTTPQIPQK
jgi:drug/metabolite transporter (DMT)-like permease